MIAKDFVVCSWHSSFLSNWLRKNQQYRSRYITKRLCYTFLGNVSGKGNQSGVQGTLGTNELLNNIQQLLNSLVYSQRQTKNPRIYDKNWIFSDSSQKLLWRSKEGPPVVSRSESKVRIVCRSKLKSSTTNTSCYGSGNSPPEMLPYLQ